MNLMVKVKVEKGDIYCTCRTILLTFPELDDMIQNPSLWYDLMMSWHDVIESRQLNDRTMKCMAQEEY